MSTTSKRTALVTGASSGMGKEIAKRLIKDGFRVYVAARNVEKMDDLARLGARPLRMDISRDADIIAAVQTILDEVDGVDVLVNNAGFGLYGPVEEVSIDEARYQFEVNLFGAARLTQLLLPKMRERRSGTIVNVTSMGARSIPCWAPGITRPSMRWRGGPIACGSSSPRSASRSSSSSPA